MKDPDSKNEVPAQQHRRWWKRKRWWLAGVLAALLVCIYTIPRFPFGPYIQYSGLTPEVLATIIPYETLASEETHPFYWGKAHSGYDGARKKWLRVTDCLVASERISPEPDLRLIDWNLFVDYDEAKVCLWRIFSSLGTPERVKRWIEFHGYDTLVSDVGLCPSSGISGQVAA